MSWSDELRAMADRSGKADGEKLRQLADDLDETEKLMPPPASIDTPDEHRAAFKMRAEEMAGLAGKDLAILMMAAYDCLPTSVIAHLDVPNKPYFLVRAFGVALGTRAVDERFDCEAIKSITRRVKRMLARRGF